MLAGASTEMAERGVVGLREILKKGSLTNILESVFGSRLGSETEDQLGHMVKEGYDLISKFNWEDYFPLRFLDFYGVKRKCHRLATEVNAVVGQIVKVRQQTVGEVSCGNDFLSALLSLPKGDQLSDSDMVAVLWVRINLSLLTIYLSSFGTWKLKYTYMYVLTIIFVPIRAA